MVKKFVFKIVEGDDKMNKQSRVNKNQSKTTNFSSVSNINGNITDSEFSTEFINRGIRSDRDNAHFQFNFNGADLEKVNNAKRIDSKLK